MISNMPSTSLFIMTLMSGTLISISSPQWIMLWAGLEINLLSFIQELMFNFNQAGKTPTHQIMLN